MQVEKAYLGTTTSNVMRYSESSTKCSRWTSSAKLRVSKLPLRTKRKELNHYLAWWVAQWQSKLHTIFPYKRIFQKPIVCNITFVFFRWPVGCPLSCCKLVLYSSNQCRSASFAAKHKLLCVHCASAKQSTKCWDKHIVGKSYFCDYFGNVLQRLFDGIFSHIPLKTCYVRHQIHWKAKYVVQCTHNTADTLTNWWV